jgi:hypothetical protein
MVPWSEEASARGTGRPTTTHVEEPFYDSNELPEVRTWCPSTTLGPAVRRSWRHCSRPRGGAGGGAHDRKELVLRHLGGPCWCHAPEELLATMERELEREVVAVQESLRALTCWTCRSLPHTTPTSHGRCRLITMRAPSHRHRPVATCAASCRRSLV